jgi:hypothetical protein
MRTCSTSTRCFPAARHGRWLRTVVISASPEDLPEGVRAGRRDEILGWLKGKRVAIPGKLTSAFLSLQIYCGEQGFDFLVVPFDEIFDAVRSGRTEAGLIIHEGQLTYQRDGFGKVVDLGEWWKAETGLPRDYGPAFAATLAVY